VITEHGAFTRGAPEMILELCDKIFDEGVERPLEEKDRKHIAEVAAGWGKKAMRVLALATRREAPANAAEPASWEASLSFVGLVGIVDPPRPEVAVAVAAAKKAGVRSVMITGDHPATARAIAEEIGLWAEGDIALSGAELDQLDQQRFEALIGRLRVVARATAAHKLRIIEALKATGKICGMTGDGVNDAPAVKAAHIGIAMGKAGTEVTKEAADLVLADDNYATIVAAVEEGRAIFANIRKFIYFLLSSNAGIVLVVLFSSLFGWVQPLTPIQILWINLITNGLPALALGVDPKDPDQMSRPPRPVDAHLMAKREWLSLLGVGTVMATCSLYLFWAAGGADGGEEVARARALAFTVLSISPMFHALNCRSQTRSIFQLGLFTNRAIWGAAAIGVALQALALYIPSLNPVFKTVPLAGDDLLLVLGLAAIPLVLGETIKLFLRAGGRAAEARTAT
jgi:Ca2+-transporting ATPase